jgi:acetyl esterase/lipase
MLISRIAILLFVASLVTCVQGRAQAAPAAAGASPAWADPANWTKIKPVETDNIVFANVPLIANPSANPDPGTPGGIRTPVPNTGKPGTKDLHLDVYQISSTKPTPVVIQLHGGGWIRGDRPNSYNTFRALLAAGMSVVAVEYRNAKDAPAPAALQDVRCAMAWVKKNAKKYNFDTNRVVMYGGSAGGHLALMGAYAPGSYNPPGCTNQPHVAAVLDFYGDTNLERQLSESDGADTVHQWLGMDLPLPSAGTAADGKPAPKRWPEPDAKMLARARELSPVTYAKHGATPTFIVNGSLDHPARHAELKKDLDAAGVPDGQYIVVGGGHGNFPKPEADKAMLLCLEFLRAQGVLR